MINNSSVILVDELVENVEEELKSKYANVLIVDYLI
jgi:hypothetical protein